MIAALQESINGGYLQLFCVDSVDAESLYCAWKHPAERIRHHEAYETYLLNEVLPFTQICNDNPFLIAHGCSLGAYHAVNIALRHPALFERVVAFSGRYDLTLAVEEFGNLFDGYYDEKIYFHTPSHFMPNLHDENLIQQIQQLNINLTIGEADPFHENASDFSQTLRAKEIEHDFHVWSGRAHRFRDWRQMAPVYL